MASTLGKPPSQQRRLSRSSSVSPSSIVTVQRAASLTSHNGTCPPVSGLRSQSPNESNLEPPTLSIRALSPDSKRRASAIYTLPESGAGVREGVGNLNRWSQSTVSSKSSSTHHRASSFTRRLSGSFSSFSGFAGPQTPPPNGKYASKVNSPPKNSPQKFPRKPSPPPPPPPTIPPIVTLSSLSQAVDATDSPSTVATVTPATAELLSPSTYSLTEGDYFGGNWKARSPIRSPQKQDAGAQRKASRLSPIASRSPPRRVVQAGSPESRRQPQKSGHTAALYSKHNPSRGGHTDRYQQPRTGHSRHRGSGRGSGGTEGESSESSVLSTRDKNRRRKTPSQKAMLSKALQKANHAVLLDNAQNFEGAMTAYSDACALLQQVMVRSSGPDDRKKLEAVRNTYTNRIIELRNTDLSFQNADGKALPDRPRDKYEADQDPFSPISGDEEYDGSLASGPVTSPNNSRPYVPDQRKSPSLPSAQIPPRRQSLRPSAFSELNIHAHTSLSVPKQPLWEESSPPDQSTEPSVNLKPPVFKQYLPPPLSPRHPLSSALPGVDTSEQTADLTVAPEPLREPGQAHHIRQDTSESTSWLDTIDESGRSSSSSVHSRTSSVGLRRKRIRAASGATEAEFDAALDAAVEAAYDDGFEPVSENDEEEAQLMLDPEYHMRDREFVSDARKNVELAKEKVREAEREAAIAAANEREKRRREDGLTIRDSTGIEYDDDEAEEEERMLEEMTKDYVMDDSEYDLQSKSALPRQSDSSGFSGRTWASSLGSNPTTAGTSLSTVAEAPGLPSMVTQLQSKALPPPSHPPPSSALPTPPQNSVITPLIPLINSTISRPSSIMSNSTPGVRDRRLSGREVKQLKIETDSTMLSTSASAGPKTQPPTIPFPLLPTQALPEPPKSASASAATDSQETLPSLTFKPTLTIQANTPRDSSPLPGPSPADATSNTTPLTPALTRVTSAGSEDSIVSMPESPGRFARPTTSSGALRKNFSSSSLKRMVSGPETLESSSKAAASGSSSSTKRVPPKIPSVAVPSLPTPIGPTFTADGLQTGAIHLFESDIHSPMSPGSPNPLASNGPLPLEPCPEPALLRPFWLLRCIYQTIAHPRGGYISNRLFIPRDIWQVKNVKLKNVEEKMSTCDLLTSALLKLAKVDTLDAAAVLVEMQFFENVMDQAQMALSKKLGSEVGVVGVSWLSKGSNAVDDAMSTSETLTSRSGITGSKYGLSSWRKLRSKNSTGPAFNPATMTTISKDGVKEPPTMTSLPMTSMPNPRFPKRGVKEVQCVGPNSNYMGALARLCDAVQILDQIARQVEDPGLKHSSPTHVGLELCTRHAAEFFGFYVCRFVMNDVGMMLDKFIKRGSEWVLS